MDQVSIDYLRYLEQVYFVHCVISILLIPTTALFALLVAIHAKKSVSGIGGGAGFVIIILLVFTVGSTIYAFNVLDWYQIRVAPESYLIQNPMTKPTISGTIGIRRER